jgi:deazaflavin-dependent oxidoreductase (nitroreductase family)
MADLASREEIIDSPIGWVNRHVRRYVESDGKSGHRWSGVNTLLLTVRGRRTGRLLRTALIYGRDGDRFVVVASNGGSRRNPMWYLNLVADPEVLVQVEAESFAARASTVSGAERTRLWGQMAAIWPHYNTYQRRATREIPVVVLERARG